MFRRASREAVSEEKAFNHFIREIDLSGTRVEDLMNTAAKQYYTIEYDSYMITAAKENRSVARWALKEAGIFVSHDYRAQAYIIAMEVTNAAYDTASTAFLLHHPIVAIRFGIARQESYKSLYEIRRSTNDITEQLELETLMHKVASVY